MCMSVIPLILISDEHADDPVGTLGRVAYITADVIVAVPSGRIVKNRFNNNAGQQVNTASVFDDVMDRLKEPA